MAAIIPLNMFEQLWWQDISTWVKVNEFLYKDKMPETIEAQKKQLQIPENLKTNTQLLELLWQKITDGNKIAFLDIQRATWETLIANFIETPVTKIDPWKWGYRWVKR